MGSFTYIVPAGMFKAATKAEANALATAYANKMALQTRFCCDFQDIIGCVGTTVAETFTILLGTGPFTWEIINGTLPAGLSMSTMDSGRTMILSGIPTAAGNTIVGVSILDTSSNQSFTSTLQIEIMTIVDSSLPAAEVGVAYSHQLTALGGSGSYFFVLTSGALPSGLTLTSTGLIAGIPTTAATSSFVISLTDQEHYNVVTGSVSAGLEPAYLISAIQLSEHIYAIHDYATLFATPPAQANIPGHPGVDTIWNGNFGDLSPYYHAETGSMFNNYMLGPQALMQKRTNPPFPVGAGIDTVIPGGVDYWYLLIAFPSTFLPPTGGPGVPYYMWIAWEGYLVTSSTSPAGTYTRFRGTMTEPTITLDQIA